VIYLYEYDDQNRLIKVSHTSWSSDLGSYYPYSRYHFIYNGNTLQENYMADYDRWGYYYGYYKQTFEYDARGRITADNISTSLDSLSWVNAWRFSYFYHPNDTSNGNSLVEYLKHGFMLDYYGSVYSFNKVGMFQESHFQLWENNSWSDECKIEYYYDSNNRLISEVALRLYGFSEWRPQVLYSFAYDSNGNLYQQLTQDWDYYAQDWQFTREQNIYNWEQFTSIEPPDLPPIQLGISTFPNPFRKNVLIYLKSPLNAPIKISVYNIKGQLIKSLGSSKNIIIGWNGEDEYGKTVSNGVYLIKAIQDGKSVSGKAIRIK